MIDPKYLLLCLMEECAEATQAASKAIRFGIEDWHPKTGITNIQRLSEECGDIVAIIDLLVDAGYIDQQSMESIKQGKSAKIERYLEYAARSQPQ